MPKAPEAWLKEVFPPEPIIDPKPISLIAAMDMNRAIGYQNQLLWNLPEEMNFFKITTQSKPVIMGRKTYESIGRPLPNRYNLVVSSKPIMRKGISWCRSLDIALERAQQYAIKHQCSEIMVIGGSKLYEQCLPIASTLYLTKVNIEAPLADAWFPLLDPGWRVVSREKRLSKKGPTFVINRYRRRDKINLDNVIRELQKRTTHD